MENVMGVLLIKGGQQFDLDATYHDLRRKYNTSTTKQDFKDEFKSIIQSKLDEGYRFVDSKTNEPMKNFDAQNCVFLKMYEYVGTSNSLFKPADAVPKPQDHQKEDSFKNRSRSCC